jgi:hypothetical protein
MQIGAALIASGRPAARFVTSIQPLARAARLEGFRVFSGGSVPRRKDDLAHRNLRARASSFAADASPAGP